MHGLQGACGPDCSIVVMLKAFVCSWHPPVHGVNAAAALQDTQLGQTSHSSHAFLAMGHAGVCSGSTCDQCADLHSALWSCTHARLHPCRAKAASAAQCRCSSQPGSSSSSSSSIQPGLKQRGSSSSGGGSSKPQWQSPDKAAAAAVAAAVGAGQGLQVQYIPAGEAPLPRGCLFACVGR